MRLLRKTHPHPFLLIRNAQTQIDGMDLQNAFYDTESTILEETVSCSFLTRDFRLRIHYVRISFP